MSQRAPVSHAADLGSELARTFTIYMAPHKYGPSVQLPTDHQQAVRAFERTSRKIKAKLSLFRRQFASLAEVLTDGLSDIRFSMIPKVDTSTVREIVQQFDEKVSMEKVLSAVRLRFPTTTKKQLLRIIKQQRDICIVKTKGSLVTVELL